MYQNEMMSIALRFLIKESTITIMGRKEDLKDKELGHHLESLGMTTIKEYQKWCQAHGFSLGLHKSDSLRLKEKQKVKELKLQEAMKKNKERLKPLDEKLKQALNKKDIIKDLIKNDSVFKNMQSEFYGSEEELPEFFDFISTLSKKSKLTKEEPIVRALWKVFKQRSHWIRLLDNWEPTTKNIHKQFTQLTRHLFTRFKIPEFLDSVWFNSSSHKDPTDWFLWIAKGNNIRKAEHLPFELTKKMAHEFLNAPSSYDVWQALRYGQIIGLGGDIRLCQAVNETFLGRNPGRSSNKDISEFWLTVIMFFINNPMLDRHQFGPIVDYIQHIKFGQNPQQPGFTIKGRNPQSLLEQVEAWHKQLQKVRGKKYKEWTSCNLKEFIKEEKSGESLRKWEVIELRNSKELEQEGRSLRHCVGSYSDSCVAKRCAIFSLRLDNERLATIEVIPSSRSVVQARGRFNALLTGKNWQILNEWAGNNNLRVSCSHA